MKNEQGNTAWKIVTLGILGRLARWTGFFYQATQYKIVKEAVRNEGAIGPNATKLFNIIKNHWFAVHAKGPALEELPNQTASEVARKLKRSIAINLYPNLPYKSLLKEIKQARTEWFDKNFKSNSRTEGDLTYSSWEIIGAETHLKKGAVVPNENMEDAHHIQQFEIRTKNKHSYQVKLVTLCDGHGNRYGKNPDYPYNYKGNEVSNLVANSIGGYIKNHLEKNKELDDTAIFNALKNACVDLNNFLRQMSVQSPIDVKREGEERKEGV